MKHVFLIKNKQYNSWHFIGLESFNEVGIAMFDWCKEQTSNGCFIATSTGWWFEKEKDALLFTLKWGTE